MKNILAEKPSAVLHGRLKYSVGFVDSEDIKSKKLLDIGCGFGWFERHALKHQPASLTGTEVSSADLDTINRHLHHPRLKTKVADGAGLPFPDSSFDTVVSWEVLEHLENGRDQLMFKEVARVLRKGGVFYMSTPYASVISKVFDPAWYLIGHRHYSLLKLFHFATQVGLSVRKVQIKGGFWDIIQALDLYLSKWILRRPLLFSDFINHQVDRDYQKDGFNDIFIKFVKC